MILTIFRSRLRPDAHDYASVAHEMETLAEQMPGFVSIKTFQHADGERCSVVLFSDWESHRAWAKHPRHLEAQRRGRDEFYSEYSVTVAEVARSYAFPKQEQPPQEPEATPGHEQLHSLYEAFNRRDIEAVLAVLKPNVQWANGLQGGFVHGRDAVRRYWLEQFETLNPRLQPLHFDSDEQGRSVITLHQTVHDLNGNLLLEQDVQHRFTFESGQISFFEIIDVP